VSAATGVLLLLCCLGCLMVAAGRDGGAVQPAGAVLALASLVLVPVGHLFGVL